MMTLVLGGARSGKSRHALTLCEDADAVVFLATASPDDDEMSERIERHRADRPSHWTTIEAPLDLLAALATVPGHATVIVDCITLWISNLMYAHREESRAERERLVLDAVAGLLEAVTARAAGTVVVSNDVGHGLVPDTSVGREFRDLLGTANQRLAATADRVVLVVAGIPMVIAGD